MRPPVHIPEPEMMITEPRMWLIALDSRELRTVVTFETRSTRANLIVSESKRYGWWTKTVLTFAAMGLSTKILRFGILFSEESSARK